MPMFLVWCLSSVWTKPVSNSHKTESCLFFLFSFVVKIVLSQTVHEHEIMSLSVFSIDDKFLFLLIAWVPPALRQRFSEPSDVGGSLTGFRRGALWILIHCSGLSGEAPTVSQESQTLFSLINSVRIVWFFNVNLGIPDRREVKKQSASGERFVCFCS